MVTGRAGHLQYATAEVVADDLVGPASEAEERLHRLELALDDRGRRSIGELSVARHVVEVTVRVGDDKLVVRTRVLGEPAVDDSVDGLAQRIAFGPFDRARVE